MLVRIDPDTGTMVDLTPSRGVKATVETFDRDVPDELVVGLNDRDPRYHDLYVLEISTGRRTLLQRVEDGRPIAVQRIDGAWHPYLRVEPLTDGGFAYELRLPGEKDWRPFLRFDFNDARGQACLGSRAMALGCRQPHHG